MLMHVRFMSSCSDCFDLIWKRESSRINDVKEAQQRVRACTVDAVAGYFYEFRSVSAILGGVIPAQSDSLSYFTPIIDTDYSCNATQDDHQVLTE